MFSQAFVSHSVHGGSQLGVSLTQTFEQDRDPLDRDPLTETPWTETLLDRDLSGQRPPGQRPLDRDPLDRDPSGQRPLWTETPWTETSWAETPSGQRSPENFVCGNKSMIILSQLTQVIARTESHGPL